MNDLGSKKPDSFSLAEVNPDVLDPAKMTGTAQYSEGHFPSAIIPGLLMVASVFLIELVIEFLMSHFVTLPLPQHVFVDAGGTVLLFLPIFYFVLYRPFKGLDAARRQTQYENKLLSRKLIRRSEEEKQRLARDLHDDFGQVLTALQFGLATLKEGCLLPDSQAQDCAQRVDRLTDMIASLGDKVRSFTLELRPAMLDELGLEAAIQILIEGDWGELEIHFEKQGQSRRYDPEMELAIFRICQEGLNNILKHARATRAGIYLACENSELRLKVSDNGIGFYAEALNSGRDRRRGFGLLGMRERADSFGGGFKLTSTPGIGTTIEIQVPADLPRRSDETDQNPDC